MFEQLKKLLEINFIEKPVSNWQIILWIYQKKNRVYFNRTLLIGIVFTLSTLSFKNLKRKKPTSCWLSN